MSIRNFILGIVVTACVTFSYSSSAQNLLDKRGDFKTSIVKEVKQTEPLETPSAEHPFKLVKYKTEIGKMSAYLTTIKPEGNQKLPAIIWITGGHPQGGASPEFIDGGSYKNNQTANMFYQRGIVTLYPTFRGTYGNPGVREEFYGEVDDLLGALKFLQSQKHIDKDRIYLGGHSTGATLALLAAAATDEFAGVLALGAQDDVINHGGGGRLFDISNSKELELRAPIKHLSSIKNPTFVIEGEHGVADGLSRMREASDNSSVSFWEVKGADHFDVIQSTSDLFADAIIESAKTKSRDLNFTQKQVTSSYNSVRSNMMRASALQYLSRVSASGVDINQKQNLKHYFYSEHQRSIDAISEALKVAKFTAIKTEEIERENGETVIALTALRKQKPSDLEQLFADQALFEVIEKKWVFSYENWYPEN